TLRPLGAQRHLAEDLPAFERSRSRVAAVGLHHRPRPPTRCRRRKKADGSGGQQEQALGRSRGGFSTQIPTIVTGLGLPVTFLVSAGQEADVSYAAPLLGQLAAEAVVEAVIADKGYDSNQVVEEVKSRGAVAVIPPRSNRKEQRAYDSERYRDRN